LLSEWFALDGALPRTLLAMARPGRLTRDYLDGRRARYLRPLRLYVVASLALFSTTLDLPRIDASSVTVRIGGEVVHEAARSKERRSLDLFQPDSLFLAALAARYPDRLEAMRQLPAQDLVDRVFEGFRRMLPTTLILFVPFLAVALRLLHLRTGALYVDHVVFAAHFQSALFFALAAVWAVATLSGAPTVLEIVAYIAAGVLMLTLYLPLALQRVFGQRPGWVAAKTLLVVLLYLRILGFALGATSALILLAA
jgi:hypothetical protein